jgi:hypothetical protein
VPGPGQHHGFVRPQGFKVQLGRQRLRAPAQHHVQAAGQQLLHQVGPVSSMISTRMSGWRAQKRSTRSPSTAEATAVIVPTRSRPLAACLQCAARTRWPLAAPQHVAYHRNHHAAAGAQPHALGVALEKLQFQQLLQLGQGLRGRGLAQAHIRRRRA